jgi:hypothetical protein
MRAEFIGGPWDGVVRDIERCTRTVMVPTLHGAHVTAHVYALNVFAYLTTDSPARYEHQGEEEAP